MISKFFVLPDSHKTFLTGRTISLKEKEKEKKKWENQDLSKHHQTKKKTEKVFKIYGSITIQPINETINQSINQSID